MKKPLESVPSFRQFRYCNRSHEPALRATSCAIQARYTDVPAHFVTTAGLAFWT